MNNISETSREAFESIKKELSQRQKEVFNALMKLEYATNTMIAKQINLPINCVTGRTRELVKGSFIIKSHISWCPITKNKAIYWRINDKQNMPHL